MAFERRWLSVELRSFVSDGDAGGLVTLGSTSGFKVKQNVKINAIGEQQLALEVKRVLSPTTLIVGPRQKGINSKTDLTNYTVAKSATISADEQDRIKITEKDHVSAIYEQEPTCADRVILVDEFGDFYQTENPLPVQLSDGNINIGSVNAELEVQLSHQDNVPDLGDIHDSVRIGDGQDQLAINEDGSINVQGDFNVGGKSTPTILNVGAVLGNTEYNFVIPSGTKKYLFKSRDNSKIQYGFTVGSTSSNFITVYPGYEVEEENIDLDSDLTIYFLTTKPNQTIEVMIWS